MIQILTFHEAAVSTLKSSENCTVEERVQAFLERGKCYIPHGRTCIEAMALAFEKRAFFLARLVSKKRRKY